LTRDREGGTTAGRSPPSYVGLELGQLLDAVGERSPAPGGGSVAALSVAFAASLVEMSARYSTGELPDAAEVAYLANGLRTRVAALADADSRAHHGVLRAMAARRRRADTDETASGDVAVALRDASQVPLQVADLGAETAELASRLVRDGNPRLRGDCATALLLAEAATRSAARLVSINADDAGGDELLVRRARRSVELARQAAAAAGLG
jgi:methenyltetrahydrofolate cyclohydrolase